MHDLALTDIFTDQGESIVVIAERGIKGYKVFHTGIKNQETAEKIADQGNKALGLTEHEALQIVLSSMR
jgi:hypothetical protein